jgi:hypothetical protein
MGKIRAKYKLIEEISYEKFGKFLHCSDRRALCGIPTKARGQKENLVAVGLQFLFMIFSA